MNDYNARHAWAGCLRLAVVMIFAGAVLAGLTATSAAAQPTGCGAPKDLVQVRTDHLTRLNAHRVRQGRGPLTSDDLLNAAAQDYACLLARTGHFDHVGPDGSTLTDRVRRVGYPFCRLAENLAKGQLGVAEVILGWARSPGHAANMRNRSLRNVGFGVAFVGEPRPAKLLSDLSGGGPLLDGPPARGALVWVQVFGAGCE